MYAELSPVTDFREACCRQHEIAECNRGGFCNFMHLRHPSRSLKRELQDGQRLSIREKERESRQARRSTEEEERRGSRNYEDDRQYRSYRSSRHEEY